MLAETGLYQSAASAAPQLRTSAVCLQALPRGSFPSIGTMFRRFAEYAFDKPAMV
jgi:hypothetical protein